MFNESKNETLLDAHPHRADGALQESAVNCAIYARVSTSEQAEKDLSIPAQVQAMRDYARQKGWTVTHEFLEPGVSAKTTDRPALQDLLAKVKSAESQIAIVLVHKIDRLARNVFDHATIKALLKQHDIRLASVVENVDDTVPGQLVENIMASIAQFYSANLSDEVKKGMRQKVLRGGWPHRPPRGYVLSRASNTKDRQIEIHPTDGPVMRRAFELYATGFYSMRVLANCLAKDGLIASNGRPLPQAHVRDLLTNPFYAGLLRWQDLQVRGNHEALVSAALFEKIQEVIKRRFRNPGVKGSVGGFPLRGLAICASCRGRMTAERHRRWGYYRCSRQSYRKELCNARFCNADKVHKAVADVCRRVHMTPSTAIAIQKAADRLIAQRIQSRGRKLAELKRRSQEFAEKEMTVTRSFLAGDLSPGSYNAATAQNRQEQHDIERKIAALAVDAEHISKTVRDTLRLATTLHDLYDVLDDGKRAELLRSVFSAVVISPAGVVGFSLNPPFDRFVKSPGRRPADSHKKMAEAILPAAQ